MLAAIGMLVGGSVAFSAAVTGIVGVAVELSGQDFFSKFFQ